MATVTLKGNPFQTTGELPTVGQTAPDFSLVKEDLSALTLSDFKGTNLILNIFPSIDTPTCAASVRTFNQRAAAMENTKVVCVSRDLPFAQKRYCQQEQVDKLTVLSDAVWRDFGSNYGLLIKDMGILARAVLIIDAKGELAYQQLVPELAQEPDYNAALDALKRIANAG